MIFFRCSGVHYEDLFELIGKEAQAWKALSLEDCIKSGNPECMFSFGKVKDAPSERNDLSVVRTPLIGCKLKLEGLLAK